VNDREQRDVLNMEDVRVTLLIVFLVILGYYTFILLNTLTMVIMLGIVAILVYIFTLHLWRNRR